jgi:hypothetical protein
MENFIRIKKNIRPEYRSGNDSQDSITEIRAFCSSPILSYGERIL